MSAPDKDKGWKTTPAAVPTDAAGLNAHYAAVRARLRGAGDIFDPEARKPKPLIMLPYGGAYDPNTRTVGPTERPALTLEAPKPPRGRAEKPVDAAPSERRPPGRPRKPAERGAVETGTPPSPARQPIAEPDLVTMTAAPAPAIAPEIVPPPEPALEQAAPAQAEPSKRPPAPPLATLEAAPPLAPVLAGPETAPAPPKNVHRTVSESAAADPLTPGWLRRWDESYPCNPNDIISAVARRHGLIRRELVHDRRCAEHRHEAMWWIARLTVLSYREIGAMFGVTGAAVRAALKRHAERSGLPDLVQIYALGEAG